MPTMWLNRERGAAALDLSIRQLQRRIAQRLIESRLTEDGRREVLVDLPEAGDIGDTRKETPRPNAGDPGDTHAGDGALVLVHSHHQLAERLVTQAEGQARRSRRLSLVGWSLVASLSVGMLLGTWWSTRAVTAARMAQDAAEDGRSRLSGELADARQMASEADSERRQMTEDLIIARTRADDLADRLAEARQEQRGGSIWSWLGYRMADATGQ